MITRIAHIGLVVSDIQRSIEFYENILGLTFTGDMIMEGESTEKLFGIKNARAHVAYLAPEPEMNGPLLELIQIENHEVGRNVANFDKTIIAEVCFETKDIEAKYEEMKAKGVKFISEPQVFDYSSQNLGVSKAAYFYDPDGIIQELLEVEQ